MKVIDLLNKIANGEEIPKKIKYGQNILTLNEFKNNYLYEDSEEYYGDELIHWFNLNDEVEIIEEEKKLNLMPEIESFREFIKGIEKDKKIEKLRTWYGLERVNNDCDLDKIEYIIKYANQNFETYFDKINEIIDYINKE